jgi:hypothetical protein
VHKKTRNSNDGLQLKDKTAYADLVSPSTKIYFFGGLFSETPLPKEKRKLTHFYEPINDERIFLKTSGVILISPVNG